LSDYADNLSELPAPQNAKYREIYKGMMIGAGGFSLNTTKEAICNGHYDLIAFGRWFLSNPDLVARLRNGNDLNIDHRNSFYDGG
jgi:N-ethylmaleimide reductase